MKIDAIYRGGRIRTMDADRPIAHTIGVHAGRVIALDDDLHGIDAEAEFDLGGAPVLPGFNDAHHHLTRRGRTLSILDLRPQYVATLDDLYSAVERAAASLPPGEWVFGSGYDQNALGAHPTAAELERVAHGRPVWLDHNSGHMGVANFAALERAGYPAGARIPEIPGGKVEVGGDGRPTGLLLERAKSIIQRVTRPDPAPDVIRFLGLGSDKALSEGITSITEPGLAAPEYMGCSPTDFDNYLRARELGKLRVRATVMPYITGLRYVDGFRDPEEWFGLDGGVRTGFGDEWLRIGPVKILTDGSLIGRSAAMTCCYHEEPDNSGMMLFSSDDVRKLLSAAHRSGWTIAAHAIGDAAIDHVLDAIEAAQREHPRVDPRHRIEHFAVASDAQIARLVSLGVTAVPQGRFISELGDGIIAALGAERSELAYRMKSLLRAGAVLPGSSDAPVVEGAPLRGIHDMVNRRTAEGRLLGASERLTVEEAVRAYTVGSAYAAKEEHRKGSLAPGMLADFIVLSDDLWQVDQTAIDRVEVGATIVGGAIAHDAGAFGSES